MIKGRLCSIQSARQDVPGFKNFHLVCKATSSHSSAARGSTHAALEFFLKRMYLHGRSFRLSTVAGDARECHVGDEGMHFGKAAGDMISSHIVTDFMLSHSS